MANYIENKSFMNSPRASNVEHGQQTLLTFDRRLGAGGAGGQFYERELAMLMLLQGITKAEKEEISRFYLATNMDEFGCFDDVIFKYKRKDSSGSEISRVIFLQAKHKDDPTKENAKITMNRMFLESSKKGKKDAFNLGDYFSSYLQVKDKFWEMKANHSLFASDFSDCDFVIYTNAEYVHQSTHQEDKNVKRVHINPTDMLNFGETDFYYEIVLGGDVEIDNKIVDFLKQSSDHYKLVKKLISTITSDGSQSKKIDGFELVNQGIVRSYQVPLAENVFAKKKQNTGAFNKRFLDGDDTLPPQDMQFRKTFFEVLTKTTRFKEIPMDQILEELHGMEIKLAKDFGKVDDDDISITSLPKFISDADIKLFLSKLQLFVNQPNHTKLSKIIRERIQRKFNLPNKSDVGIIYSKVNKKIESWWEKKNYYLTEKHDYFEEVNGYLQKLKRPPAENLPEQWQVPSQNFNFIGRKKLLKDVNEHFGSNRIVTLIALHGLGGIGKTQSALEFAWKHYENYKGTIWFDAKNKATLINDYIKLGRELNIIREDEDNVLNEDCAKRVKHWLEDSNHDGWLLVCDNASNYKEIADLLPTQGGNILITSRYEFGWPQLKNVVLVDVFTPEESREYICKVLQLHDTDMAQIDDLAKILGHLPLALAQACAYMTKTNVSILGYLKLYRDRKQALLSNEALLETFPAGTNSGNATTVYVTWDITLESIEKVSTLAAKWFTACAYFGSNAIPISMLEVFAEDSKNNPASELFNEALGTLKSYSMLTISNENRTMTIHNLVQEVIRLKAEKTGETESNLKNVLELIQRDVLLNPKSSVDCAESVWNHSKRFLQLVKEFSFFPSSIIIRFNDGVRYEEAIAFGEQAVKHLQAAYRTNRSCIITTKFHLAIAMSNQGKYDEALEIFHEVLEKNKMFFGLYRPHTLVIKSNIAMVLNHKGEYDNSLKIFRELLCKTSQTSDPCHIDVLNLENNIGVVLCNKGKHEEALQVYEKVLSKCEKSLGPDHSLTLQTKNNIAVTLPTLGRSQEAIQVLKDLLKVLNRPESLGPDHPNTLLAKHNLAALLEMQGCYGDAMEVSKEVMQSKAKIFGEDHQDTLHTKNTMALVLHKQGKYPEALKLFEEILDNRLKALGPSHRYTLSTKNNIAAVLDYQGKLDEALKIYLEVLDAAKNGTVFNPDHPETLTMMNNIVVVLIKLHRYDEAEKLAKEVLMRRTKVLGPHHSDTLLTRQNIGQILEKNGKDDEALNIFESVHDTQRKQNVLGPNHPETLSTRNKIAKVLEKKSKWEEALEIYQEVYDTQKNKNVLGENHPFTLSTQENIAQLLIKKGEYDVALNMFQELCDKKIKIFGSDNNEVLDTKKTIASVLDKLKKYDEALQIYNEVLDKEYRMRASFPYEISATKNNIALVLHNQGKHEEAIKMYKEILEADEKAITDSNASNRSNPITNILITKSNLGTAYYSSGDLEESLVCFKEIFEKKAEVFGKEHPETIENQQNVAYILAQLELWDESLAVFQELLDVKIKVLGSDHQEVHKIRSEIAELKQLCSTKVPDDAILDEPPDSDSVDNFSENENNIVTQNSIPRYVLKQGVPYWYNGDGNVSKKLNKKACVVI